MEQVHKQEYDRGHGARTQAVFMRVFTTLKQRGLNPIDTVEQALRTYIAMGKLPPVSNLATANA